MAFSRRQTKTSRWCRSSQTTDLNSISGSNSIKSESEAGKGSDDADRYCLNEKGIVKPISLDGKDKKTKASSRRKKKRRVKLISLNERDKKTKASSRRTLQTNKLDSVSESNSSTSESDTANKLDSVSESNSSTSESDTETEFDIQTTLSYRKPPYEVDTDNFYEKRRLTQSSLDGKNTKTRASSRRTSQTTDLDHVSVCTSLRSSDTGKGSDEAANYRLNRKLSIIRRHAVKVERTGSERSASEKEFDMQTTGSYRRPYYEVDTETFYGLRLEKDRRIVLVGRTGSGKSATGNTILQAKVFKSKTSATSITERCEQGSIEISGRRLIVTDTPGLFDTRLTQGEVTRELIRCIQMSAPGPHVFLLVLRVDRFTEEEIQTFTGLFEIFGERMSEFSLIVFTHLDDLELERSSIEQFIASSGDALKQLIRKVRHGYLALNNRASSKQISRQSRCLLKYVEKIVAINGGNYYTNAMYREAEENLRRKIQAIQKIKTEEKIREIKKVEGKFIHQIKAAERSNEGLKEEIRIQNDEKMKMKHEQIQKMAEIKDLQNEMSRLTSHHERELYNIKKEEKRQAEIRLESLRNKQSEISEMRRKMTTQSHDTIRVLKELKKSQENEIQNIHMSFQAEMKETVQSIIKANTSKMAKYEKKMNDAIRENGKLKEDNNALFDLVSHYENLVQMCSESEERYNSKMMEMTSTIRELKCAVHNKKDSSCQIM